MRYKPIYQFKDFALEHYGDPLFRVPVDLGRGCPHRQPSGAGGCAFCPPDGARAAQLGDAVRLEEQVERSIDFARRRYKAKRFMAYLQTYTNTWDSLKAQAEFYDRLLNIHAFDAVSIGTRPDCLPGDVLSLLEQLNDRVEVWLDLGIQSIHDKSLRRVGRGHDWKTGRQAIIDVAQRGLRPVAHLIVGLPGEDLSDYKSTAEVMAHLPLAGIKLHNLHVIKGSALAHDYSDRPFHLLTEHQYCECLIEMLRRLPSDLPIMRMTTDTPGEKLVGPRWTMSKGEFESHVMRQMCLREVFQGDMRDASAPYMADEGDDTATATEDGSITFWSSEYNEHYHSKIGAVTEARKKYIEPTRLEQRIASEDLRVLDICFGLGYNSLCACEATLRSAGQTRLRITALEMDRRAVRHAAALPPPADSMLDWQEVLTNIYSECRHEEERIHLEMIWGDARHTITSLDHGAYDIVFLDPFSTQRNSELWTLDFFRSIRRVMNSRGILATYCAALPVRGGMIQAGFHIGESIPVGRKRSGTIAAIRAEDTANPIDPTELDRILNTSRGLPYRDPHACWSNSKILRRRELSRRSQ